MGRPLTRENTDDDTPGERMPAGSREEDAIRLITERLRYSYRGHRAAEEIEAAVAEAQEHFSQTRIRDFIPVLIERRARAALDSPRPDRT